MVNKIKQTKEGIEGELLNLLDDVFSISFTPDITPADFEKYTIVGPKFLEILLSKNREGLYAEILVKETMKIISENNLEKNYPKVPKVFISKISYELFTAIIAYMYRKGLKSKYIISQKLLSLSQELEKSSINTLFTHLNLSELVDNNNQVRDKISNNKTRELPLSFLIEIPLGSEKRFWVLYEQKGNFTSQNLQKGKQSGDMNDIFAKISQDIHNLRDSYVTIFFGDKEPNPIKINTVQQESTKSLNKAVFRDQVGTIIFYAGMFFDSSISLSLSEKAEKFKALILLGIAPVLLRKEMVEEVYQSYGIDFKNFEKNSSSGNGNDGKGDGTGVRNYPYDNTLKLKIGDLMEDDEKKETNSRVVHKRLLPILKRPDGSYISAKPSQRAINIAEEKGFTLGIGIGFPEKGKCIYPEKTEDLLSQLGVSNIDNALIKLSSLGEKGVLRYETLVIPTQESQHDVEKTIKAKVSGIMN